LVRETAGERSKHVELNALVQRVIVTDDRHRAARELAAQWPQLSAEDILATPYVLVGTVDQIADDLRARRERWGISYVMTHEPFMEALAPVVERLAGR